MFSGWRLCRYTRSCIRSKISRLLWQPPDWRSEEDDRQVATCPQLGSTSRLEHAQVRPGTHSFPAKSTALAGRCRPGSVQSLRPGVQMSVQDGSWIPVYLLPTSVRHLWPSPPATVVISTSHAWNLLRTEDVRLHTPALRIGTYLLTFLTFLLTFEAVVFLFHLSSATSRPFSSLSTRLAHSAFGVLLVLPYSGTRTIKCIFKCIFYEQAHFVITAFWWEKFFY